MPLYEYRCTSCSEQFEALVRPGETPVCRSCGSRELERLVSLFAVDSEHTRQAARDASMPKAKKQQFDKEVSEVEEYRRHRH